MRRAGWAAVAAGLLAGALLPIGAAGGPDSLTLPPDAWHAEPIVLQDCSAAGGTYTVWQDDNSADRWVEVTGHPRYSTAGAHRVATCNSMHD